MNTDRLIKIAKDLKPLHQSGSHFVISFAVKHGRILRIGINNYKKTDTINKDYLKADGHIAPFRHSESDLIKKMRFTEKERITVYVIRISNSGNVSLAKPCCHCAYLLGKEQFKAVYYSNNEGKFERL